jgi:hypothetical protein
MTRNQETPSTSRPEMKGPQNTDLDNILAGLKPKTPTNVNIHAESENDNDDSMISISSLKDMQTNTIPKRSGRKPRSDKNVISLDI